MQTKNIRGEVTRITFRNQENGYVVLQFKEHNNDDTFTVVGNNYNINSGEEAVITGNFTKHPKFGRQFEATSIQAIEPNSIIGIEKLLISKSIKGIGPKTAKKIIKVFGIDTLTVLREQPEKVAKIAGIGDKKALIIQQCLVDKSAKIEIERYFYQYNFTAGIIEKIFTRYGLNAVKLVTDNPYRLGYEIDGIGFLTADKLAQELGVASNSDERKAAAIFYILKESSSDGNCYLTAEVLANRTRELLSLDSDQDLESALNILITRKLVIKNENYIYLKNLYEAEDFVATFIANKLNFTKSNNFSNNNLEQALAITDKQLNLTLSTEQKLALQLAAKNQILLITGGPGCGKTTVIRALINFFKINKLEIALAAPTGKAAQRVGQVCNFPAKTIHRLLKYNPHFKNFEYGLNNPLQVDPTSERLVDVLIVDEASMIDIQLAKSLFSAIPKQCKLILVGDKDQLPSVGPGRLFADLIAIENIPKVILSKIFRRDETSNINDIAHSVNMGVVPKLPIPDGNLKSDIYFIERDNTDDIERLVENLYFEQIPEKFGIRSQEITILTPSNKGQLGTIALNKKIQSRLTGNNPSLNFGEEKFNLQDRVCQRVNNYQIHEDGVFNGDQGFVTNIDNNKNYLILELWDKRRIKYEKKDLPQIALAYALTIHRSQGSEIPCVILIVHDRSHFILLERQLLYTGITRAKKLLIIVGTKRAIAIAAKKTSEKLRNSDLIRKISKYLGQSESTIYYDYQADA